MNAQPYADVSAPNVVRPSELADAERRLIESCLRGERDAQRQFYEQFCENVYRLMFRMVGASDADDLTQQVFLRVFMKLDTFAGKSSFATWLYRLASNEALQFLRRSRRNNSMSPLRHEPIDECSSTSTHIDQRDMLEWALNQLDPDLRAIILLREVEGMSYHDISMTLDIFEGTVASRLNRARKCLRELIEEAPV